MPNKITTDSATGPFTLTPPASPAEARLLGGPQGDQPAGAVERVFLQRGGRINGPDDPALLVEAISYRNSTAVRVELRDRGESGPEQLAISRIVAPHLLIDDSEFTRQDWSELVLERLCEYANAIYRDRVALHTAQST